MLANCFSLKQLIAFLVVSMMQSVNELMTDNTIR
ncbi:hypothetical protein K027_4356, partial [Acinetobacter baumannii 45057_1]